MRVFFSFVSLTFIDVYMLFLIDGNFTVDRRRDLQQVVSEQIYAWYHCDAWSEFGVVF